MLEHPDRALADWGAALRRDKGRRRKLFVRGAPCVSVCAAVLATIALPPSPHWVWNSSASMPLGLYRVTPGSRLLPDDLAVARPPDGVRTLAARRHYLPLGVPLIKDVVATRGQRVCAVGDRIMIDGIVAAIRRPADRLARPLPQWRGCQTLTGAQVFLLGRSADSFDGRYFGPTDAQDLVGRAVPVWLR